MQVPQPPVTNPESSPAGGTLATAANLARRGQYAEAETLLASLPTDGPMAAPILDLKARVFAQQGRYVEAEACWIEAIRQSPGNPAYQAALARIREDRVPFGGRFWGFVFVGLCILAAAGMLSWRLQRIEQGLRQVLPSHATQTPYNDAPTQPLRP